MRFLTIGGRPCALHLLLQCYTHVLGGSPVEFIKTARSLESLDGELVKGGDDAPAFLVVNDDLSDRASAWEVEQVTMMLGGWMEDMWPQKVRAFLFLLLL